MSGRPQRCRHQGDVPLGFRPHGINKEIYIYKHMYIYTYLCIYIYTYTYPHMYVETYIYILSGDILLYHHPWEWVISRDIIFSTAAWGLGLRV